MKDKLRQAVREVFNEEILLALWIHEKCPPNQQEFRGCQLDSNIKHERCLPCWEEWLDYLTDEIMIKLGGE